MQNDIDIKKSLASYRKNIEEAYRARREYVTQMIEGGSLANTNSNDLDYRKLNDLIPLNEDEQNQYNTIKNFLDRAETLDASEIVNAFKTQIVNSKLLSNKNSSFYEITVNALESFDPNFSSTKTLEETDMYFSLYKDTQKEKIDKIFPNLDSDIRAKLSMKMLMDQTVGTFETLDNAKEKFETNLLYEETRFKIMNDIDVKVTKLESLKEKTQDRNDLKAIDANIKSLQENKPKDMLREDTKSWLDNLKDAWDSFKQSKSWGEGFKAAWTSLSNNRDREIEKYNAIKDTLTRNFETIIVKVKETQDEPKKLNEFQDRFLALNKSKPSAGENGPQLLVQAKMDKEHIEKSAVSPIAVQKLDAEPNAEIQPNLETRRSSKPS